MAVRRQRPTARCRNDTTGRRPAGELPAAAPRQAIAEGVPLPVKITSQSNPKARYVRRLGSRAFRARERRLIVEGVRLVEEALAAGSGVDFVFVSEDVRGTDRGRRLSESLRLAGVPMFDVSPTLLEELGDTVTSQGILAVAAWPDMAWPDSPRSVVALDGIRDPGNVGTVLRTAQAAAVDCAVVTPGTADATSPKVVRSAAGAHFRLPILRAPRPQLAELAGDSGLDVWVADVDGDARYDSVDWRRPFMLVVGGEAEGPSQEALDLGRTVHIPMPGGSDSLNAGVAAAVLLFEALRRRGFG